MEMEMREGRVIWIIRVGTEKVNVPVGIKCITEDR